MTISGVRPTGGLGALPLRSSGLKAHPLEGKLRDASHPVMEGYAMEQQDREVARRIRDIIAVASDDIDAISVAVEDGVAYIEGVVSGESERRAILSAVRNVEGLDRVITC